MCLVLLSQRSLQGNNLRNLLESVFRRRLTNRPCEQSCQAWQAACKVYPPREPGEFKIGEQQRAAKSIGVFRYEVVPGAFNGGRLKGALGDLLGFVVLHKHGRAEFQRFALQPRRLL
jgi:hypothetical protein